MSALPHMPILPISYSHGLVVVSVFLAVVAAYAAFGLSDRMRLAKTRATRYGWLAGGSAAMGIGIWSMHYLGMLAIRLPVPVFYDIPTVILSLLLAIAASAVALVVACVPKTGWKQQILGGILMGAGIGTMHYVGMAAMRSSAMQVYSARMIALSVATAVLIATFALRMLSKVQEAGRHGELLRLGAGILMGLGIAAMHYLSMTAVYFTADNMPYSTRHALQIGSLGEIGVILAATGVLLIALLSAAVDKTMYHRLRQAHAELAESRLALLESEQKLRELNLTLSELSIRDGLTSLHNRRHFDHTLEVEWNRAIRSRRPLTFLMLDVDHFKRLNDTYGHPYGDICLRGIARILDQQPRRVSDLTARIGGEEFGILLPDTALEGGLHIAESIRQAVQNMVLEHTTTRPTQITVSIGVSTFTPSPGDSRHAFFASADQAMYEAKGAGRNRVCIAPAMTHTLSVALD